MTDTSQDIKLLLNPYGDWAIAEGVPIIEDFGVDLHAVEVADWPRFGTRGGIVHLKGRGDYVSMFVHELPPGGQGTPQRHLFEEVCFVLSGHGSTSVDLHDGSTQSFEWGTNSLFALPLNAGYRHFNASGKEPARMVCVVNLPMMLNAFHNEPFIFDNPYRFVEREGESRYYRGEGDFIPVRPGRHMWETNFIPDLAGFELQKWSARGANSSNMKFILADATMHAHSSEMPVGTYKKAHRHGADFHVMCVTGHGYSLLWYGEDADYTRVDWKHGTVFAPPDMMYHQHFNTSSDPARYLAMAYGSLRYPFSSEKRDLFSGVDVNVRDGGRQIEYGDQDPRIHRIFLDELAQHGVASGMGEFIDESAFS